MRREQAEMKGPVTGAIRNKYQSKVPNKYSGKGCRMMNDAYTTSPLERVTETGLSLLSSFLLLYDPDIIPSSFLFYNLARFIEATGTDRKFI